MVKTDNTSVYAAQKDDYPGRAYFIRHGESTSNERNIFAGVLDVDLTAFGRLQARRAGVDIKKKGVKFDAVYVSQLDEDGSNALDKDEIMELLGRIEDMTTGERSSEEIRRYVTDYLFNILDADKNGTVDLQELEDYVSTYGLVANLNVVSAAASPVTT
ncbi:histidine phosphatase family protein [Tolypothrix sp. VBCCA 56010]|uniref:histidine phosphatase family protein n=1 Tax=Tolypothrix sp. VBCCA 56010 TaxID=3137731 RepID=UPI003D7E1524